MNKFRFTTLGLIAAILLAGCATAPAEKTAADGTKTNSDDYERVRPIGSHISGRVKKKPAQTTESEEEQSKELVRNMQQMGRLVDEAEMSNNPTPPPTR